MKPKRNTALGRFVYAFNGSLLVDHFIDGRWITVRCLPL